MEKIIEIDGKKVPFKSTGAFLLHYKAQFGKDALADLIKMEKGFKSLQKNKCADDLDTTALFNFIWVLAKTANPKIKPPMEWLDSFNEFPLYDIVPELQELIYSTIQSSVKSKN